MSLPNLAPIYLAGIALNIVALVYAITTGSVLYALAFVFVIVYLTFRYRMLKSEK